MMRRRKTILINRKFQYRFIFYVCSWVFVMSFIYPILVYEIFNMMARIFAVSPTGPELERLADKRRELVILLGSLQLLFLTTTFLVSMFISHRIAGPLFKLRKFLDKARDGFYREDLSFRKADHFQELAISYNDMLDGFRAHQSKVRSHLEKAKEACSDETARQEIDLAIRSLERN